MRRLVSDILHQLSRWAFYAGVVAASSGEQGRSNKQVAGELCQPAANIRTPARARPVG